MYVDNALVLWKGKESEYKNNLALIVGIDLSGNRLVGKIPEEISSLVELNYFNLSRNKLNGHVIQKIGELKMLESLDSSRNQISGEIPTGITRLNFLAVLDLSNNNLSGKIPSNTQLQSFDASAYSGNDELCRLPLPNECPGDETTMEPSVGKDDIIQGNEDGFINREFYVSKGLGFGVGFGGLWHFIAQTFMGTCRFQVLEQHKRLDLCDNNIEYGQIEEAGSNLIAANMARVWRQLHS
ncbi:receptor-like protein EIX2 [Cornus florida]|uniref:receptor-like protein EIX2 n=1 Tax=Cornus florida TaxID=4283 RepID=UPI00289C1DDA|nr:receptor-like protein EIX2 [Cornus florida]